MRPNDLAEELGIDGRQLRGWLREAYPRRASERGASWELTEEQVLAARARFAGRARSRPGAATVVRRAPAQVDGRDWIWEGNVVVAVVRYLESDGWRILW